MESDIAMLVSPAEAVEAVEGSGVLVRAAVCFQPERARLRRQPEGHPQSSASSDPATAAARAGMEDLFSPCGES